MRWLLVCIWCVLVGGMVWALSSVNVATSAPLAQATAYPPPPTRVTPTSGPSVPFPTSFYLYLPSVTRVGVGSPLMTQLGIQPERSGGYRIQWAWVGNTTLYQLYEARQANLSDARLIKTVGQSEPPEHVFGAKPPGVYYYWVVTYNRFGSTASAPLRVTVPNAPRLTIQEVSGGGYAVAWTSVEGSREYRLWESTSPTMLSAQAVNIGRTVDNRADFGPRVRGAYYYQMTVLTDQVGVLSEVLRVSVPRPGLSGVVTAAARPAEGIVIQLRQCALVRNTCMNRTTLDSTMTLSDGSYSFTNLAAVDAGTAYYVLFDNPHRSPTYLNFWRGRDVIGYNGRDTVEASSFEIANLFLEEPAPGARLANPVPFRWQRRPNTADNYCVMFLDGQLDPVVPCYTLGYVDYTRLDVEGVLSFNTLYNWTMWVENAGQGYGEAFYYRPLTILRNLTGLGEGLRLYERSLKPPDTDRGVPQRETRPPMAER